ncbi:MAG: EAL domain-containing response regulator [Deltaproteobacteria bacterium]|nr:EAL domain-containing response regulator [Deltaproteobacteria bacterium]
MKPRVLLVDDDGMILRSLGRMLRQAGYDVRTAADSSEALRVFASEGPDVVLSDLSMPEGDGIALLRAVRLADGSVPVILMSGAPTLDATIEAVNLHADRFLTKPVARDVLLSALEEAVEAHRAHLRALPEVEIIRPVDELAFQRALSGLWIAFQPIVAWSSRRIAGYEALLRTPSLGPQELLTAAERLDRVAELGRLIRGRAVAAMKSADPSQKLFLNLHPADLLDPDLFAKDTPLAAIADRVVLEITERAPLSKTPALEARLAELRERGFTLAIDDLGAGYAGLTGLTLVRPDVVKLDRDLIRGIDLSATLRKVVSSTIRMCQDLGTQVVAEGVETSGECETLVSLGCDLLQGFLFAKPARPFPEVRWPSATGRPVPRSSVPLVAAAATGPG